VCVCVDDRVKYLSSPLSILINPETDRPQNRVYGVMALVCMGFQL